MGFEPRRAVVAPRANALSPFGDPLPLHDHVGRLLDRGATGFVNVVGAPGFGKTVALHHLAAVFSDAPLRFVDSHDPYPPPDAAESGLTVIASARRIPLRTVGSFRLCGWGRDDFIEYLLASRPDRCGSVMARLKGDPSPPCLNGIPELWAVVFTAAFGSWGLAELTSRLVWRADHDDRDDDGGACRLD